MPERFRGQEANMYGAILGDIIGSPFEFDRGEKQKILSFLREAVDLRMILL